jgi:hypothetical protein
VRPAILAEQLGIPAVAVAGSGFMPLVRVLGKQEGVPDIHAAEYRGTFSVESDAQIRQKLEEGTFAQIVNALTGRGETKPRVAATAGKSGVALEGSFDDIQHSFRKQGLTDGLPIIPPTEQRVAEFLQFTDRSADDVIAFLPPGNLNATPRNIAANAVMAGCRPEHMPIIIAAVEAIAHPDFDLEQLGTTGAVNPYLVINGPVINELGIHFDMGLVSRDPNPAIGRALGLIIRNIAKLKPAEQYMGTFGYITPFALAEDEGKSPWPPYHVEHGFDQGTSTVTVGGTQAWGFQGYPSGTDLKGMLDAICQDVAKKIVPWGPLMHKDAQMLMLLITAPVAQVLAEGGYSKADVAQYVFEHTRYTIRDIELILKHGFCCGETETIKGLVEQGMIPPAWAKLGPDDTVPALIYPHVINIVVCGDRTRNKTQALHAAYVKPVTKEIKLPKNWSALKKNRA